MEEKVLLLNYNDVIKDIENKENHLLIGNGFNYGLGVSTGYSAIFAKMSENNRGVYKDAESIMEECGNDLEKFIGRLEQDIANDNAFLKKYVKNKVKFDFMQATHEIVKSKIKNVYAEKNEGVFILLEKFTNYFSLNYDSFLYLFLLKHKSLSNDEKNLVAFDLSIKFIENDFDVNQNNIYTEIKEARSNGILTVSLGTHDTSMEKSFSKLTKSHFTTEVKEYSKTNKKGWKTKDIDRVVKKIFKKNKQIEYLILLMMEVEVDN